MLQEFVDGIIVKRLVVFMAAYFATHGFHHWGINIIVSIDSPALKESILGGIVVLHGWACKKYPGTLGKWL